MRNRAWGALGAAWVLATVAGGSGVSGCARAGGGEALAAASVGGADDDESGVDSADDPAVAADVEAPEVGDEGGGSGDDASQGTNDSGSSGDSSSGSDEGSGDDAGSPVIDAGSPVIDAGLPVIVVDSGGGVPPSGAVEVGVESGVAAADAGAETASPTDSGAVPESGASRRPPSGGGLHVAMQDPGAGTGDDPVGAALGGAPDDGDDASSSWEQDDASFGGSWAGDGDAPPALQMQPSRAVLGCAGCSVPDAGGSGALAWLLVALPVAARALRRRRRR
jgi:hypothetical protein